MAASIAEGNLHAAPPALGTVVALWRYPVKSMLGEELNAAEVTQRGLLGDRAFALVDPATGKVAWQTPVGQSRLRCWRLSGGNARCAPE